MEDAAAEKPEKADTPQQHPAGIVRDEIFITEGTKGYLRTIAVSTSVPASMTRSEWRLTDFDMHKELYRGKTSMLYMATDKLSGIPIALKLYRKRKLSTLNRYQVEREIRIHIKLDHLNIIRLYAAFEDDKNVYMVQEFAGGGDLFEDLKRNGGSFKEKHVVRDIIVPFLNALQYLHGMGIIHRDIKPENILLTSHRIIKIADFGLSICHQQERPVTRAGTLDYMAPEVLICPDKRRPEENKDKVLLAYTPQVDAWAVGILCYELMVGYPPFEQESRAATYEHIMYKEPKFPNWMSEEAKQFITLALNKVATQRPTIMELGRQPLILAYAKPVDKPPEARLPQEFLVERSPNSILATNPPSPSHSNNQPSAPSTPTHSTATQPQSTASLATAHSVTKSAPLPPALHQGHAGAGILGQVASNKRPGPQGLDISMDSDAGSGDTSPAGKVQPKVSQTGTAKADSNRSSGMIIDEDASYTITDCTTEDNGPTSPKSSHQLLRNPSSLRAGCQTKSRLGASQGGGQPGPTPPSMPIAVAQTISLPQGKVAPASPPVRISIAEAASPEHQVEHSGGSYYKPKSGILSDDHAFPVPRCDSSPGAVGTPTKALSMKQRSFIGMERPPLERLLATQLDEPIEAAQPAGSSSNNNANTNNNKYSKLFAKMWGRNPPGTEAAQTFIPEAAMSSSSSFTTPTKLVTSPSTPGHVGLGQRSMKGGQMVAARSLAEDFLAERADSIVLTDRNGSVVGAPSMQLRKPVARPQASQDAHKAGAHMVDPATKTWHRSALLEEPAGLQRSGSEAMITRGTSSISSPIKHAVPAVTGSGRSFTSSSSPTMKQLANAPIVNKIQAMMEQGAQEGRS